MDPEELVLPQRLPRHHLRADLGFPVASAERGEEFGIEFGELPIEWLEGCLWGGSFWGKFRFCGLFGSCCPWQAFGSSQAQRAAGVMADSRNADVRTCNQGIKFSPSHRPTLRILIPVSVAQPGNGTAGISGCRSTFHQREADMIPFLGSEV